MAINPLTTIIQSTLANTAGRVVNAVVGKYLPATMSEQDKADMALEIRKLSNEEAETATADVASARELAMKESEDAPPWANVLKVTHRPLWSFVMLAIFSWTILAPYLGYPQIPLTEVHKSIMQTVIIFYFGGRSVEKAVAIGKGLGKP